MSLSLGEQFRSAEVFQIFVVGDDIYWRGRTLEIVSPTLESFKNCHELFVVDIVIELGTSEV